MGSPTGNFKNTSSYQIWSSGPATTVTFTVYGDNDGGHLIEFDFVQALGTVIYTIQPNGLTASQFTRIHQFDGAYSSATSTDLRIAVGTNGNHTRGTLNIRPRSGTERMFIADAFRYAGGDVTWNRYTGIWSDTSTVVTSYTINADTANGIGSGSWITITKIGNPKY